MSLTYDWKIKGLKKQDNSSLQLNDIIVQTYWECTGTDENGNAGVFYGATSFELDQVDPNNFTSYEDLTEAHVINWIKETVNNNQVYKDHIDEQIYKQIIAIVQTYWECTGTDAAGNSGTFHGATPFEPDQVDPANFTTYENLTEAQVLSWIQDVVNNNPGYKAHIDEQIQKQIDAIVRPMAEVQADALPWAEPAANTAPTPTANTK